MHSPASSQPADDLLQQESELRLNASSMLGRLATDTEFAATPYREELVACCQHHYLSYFHLLRCSDIMAVVNAQLVRGIPSKANI